MCSNIEAFCLIKVALLPFKIGEWLPMFCHSINSSKHARQLLNEVIVHTQKQLTRLHLNPIRIFCFEKLAAFSVTFALFMAFDTTQAKSITPCAEGARRFIKFFADFAKHNFAFYISQSFPSSYFPRILESSFPFFILVHFQIEFINCLFFQFCFLWVRISNAGNEFPHSKISTPYWQN